MNTSNRRVEKFISGKGWKVINPETLKRGDLFRMFEPNGTIVINNKFHGTFIALSDSFINGDGNWAVQLLDNGE